MAQRGRPRKVQVETPEPDSVKEYIAQLLSVTCGILGCQPKHHYEDAEDIIGKLKEKGMIR